MTSRRPESAPLRVVLLDSIEEWGGGEKWCLQTASTLRARGHQASIACFAKTPLAERANAAGIPVWSEPRGPLGWRLGASLRLSRFLREHGSEALIANVGRDVRMGAFTCRMAGAALLQRRGLLRPIKPNPVNRWLYEREVRRVIVNSMAIRDRMRERAPFVEASRFVLIPNGIDTDRPRTGDGARARAELGIDAGVPLVLSVGRLAPMKGHAHLLDAWASLRETRPEARLVVVGEGALRAELEAQASRLHVERSVLFTGFRRELDDLYPSADVFVLPSVRDEGCNNALLEAMWHGVPAVVTDCGGLPEVAVDRETGLVVGAGDTSALANALGDLLGSEPTRLRMGAAATRRIEESYSLPRVTEMLEDLLLELRRAG